MWGDYNRATYMARRVLFVIRGKLGDSLVAFATVRSYADAFPSDDTWLLTRSNYAPLFAKEANIRVVGFSSRLEMFWLLVKLRAHPMFDALLVLWGFGNPIKWIGRMIKARRKIYLDGRYRSIYTEYADLSPQRLQSEPMWQVAKLFEPALPQPVRLRVPSLAAKRIEHPVEIGIAPLADEPRRIMSPPMLADLLVYIGHRHPGCAVLVFVNPSDRGAAELIAAGLPVGAAFHFFPQLDDLLAGLARLSHIYCTDTGLYHLAAAMGIPATVFYGPTQPWRNMMPGQVESLGVRLAVLASDHCEEKSCESPMCIGAAVRAVSDLAAPASLDGAPVACPLRAHPLNRLSEVSWHENPRHQT
jgi:ADP-heptose:LPS heptosyltransferase